MEKMLVVVFENEKKAFEGTRALANLDFEGSIAIHAQAVIQKNQDGTVSMKQAEDDFPVRTVGGTAIGSLIGLLGGPIGLGIGAAVGATTGMVADVYVAGVDEDFLADVAAKLTPGKVAVVADISEEWVTPLDTRMEALGGVVFRTVRQDFEAEQRAKEIAALNAEIAELKAEVSQAKAERKANIQAKIDDLNRKLQAKLDQAKQRSEQLDKETDAKVKALQTKLKNAPHETKTAINDRISEIRNRYEQSVATLRSTTANKLRKAAAKLDKASQGFRLDFCSRLWASRVHGGSPRCIKFRPGRPALLAEVSLAR